MSMHCATCMRIMGRALCELLMRARSMCVNCRCVCPHSQPCAHGRTALLAWGGGAVYCLLPTPL
jgi:hypothetical protein